MELVWLTDAKYIEEYTLRLTFNDGKTGLMDFRKYLDRKLFEPLKNIAEFKKFAIGDRTISWMNGRLDIAPETLYKETDFRL